MLKILFLSIFLFSGIALGIDQKIYAPTGSLILGASSDLKLNTAGTQKAVLKSTGKFGLNLTVPLSQFDVGISSTDALTIGNTATNIFADDLIGNLAFVSRDVSTNSSGAIGSIRSYATTEYNSGSVSGDLRFYTQNNGQPNGSVLSGTEAMRIRADGRVAVGTASANQKLQVNGAVDTPGGITNGHSQLWITSYCDTPSKSCDTLCAVTPVGEGRTHGGLCMMAVSHTIPSSAIACASAVACLSCVCFARTSN